MYASLGHELPADDGWTFEPKYDGMRVIALASSRAARLVTRNGKEKTDQFPEIAAALTELARASGRTFVLDGEIVARAPRRRSRSASAASEFQQLQSRMHVRDAEEIVRLSTDAPATLVIFDLLRDGRKSFVGRSWNDRRGQLESLFATTDSSSPALMLGETSAHGAAMLARARKAGWEGIIAKRSDVAYQPGARSRDWLKIKLQFRAEFVVGGFTEPRRTRMHLGALLLGAYDTHGDFIYVGHTGGGFTNKGLGIMREALDKLERRSSPFVHPPRTNERAHWVSPRIIVEVKFAEWTSAGLLRQPIFLGVRDDKSPKEVLLEGVSAQRWSTSEATK
jgi:bifunctional non-homologous end joining protein LigD